MLQPGIHRAIIESIILCCSSEYIPEWIQKQEQIVKGVHPFQLLRVLCEFFQSEDIKRRTVKVKECSKIGKDNRSNTAMEDFNGFSGENGIYGGLGYSSGKSRYGLSSEITSFKTEEEIDQLIWKIYSGYKVQGMFVHKYSGAIGETNCIPGGGVNEIDKWVYDVNLETDKGVFVESMMTNFSEKTKQHYILLFLKKLCETYKGEEKMNYANRSSWYEVSEFVQFYFDVWDRISGPGDDEIWWKTMKKEESSGTIYELKGVDVGNEVIDNFKAVYLFHCEEGYKMMKIGNDIYGPYGIWLKKYEAYCQRMFEEEDCFVYKEVLREESGEGKGDPKELLQELEKKISSVKDDINVDTYKEIKSKIKQLEECV